MDSGSDDEVLEIYSFTQCFFYEGKKEEIEKNDVGAQYFLPTSIERRIPPYRYYTSVFEVYYL